MWYDASIQYMQTKLTTDAFIAKAQLVHGHKYNYSKVNYKDAITKVILICNQHGEFSQMPYSHLSSRGCPKCARISQSEKRKSNIENFIAKAQLVHGDRYSYLESQYGKNNRSPITILCKEHGEFSQVPYSHLAGRGCPQCGDKQCGDQHRSNTEDFISKAKSVHGDTYDYSKAQYSLSDEKIIIICKEHGEFLQTPDSHVQGQGCPKCGGTYLSNTEDFISKSKLIHGDLYDYSEVDYTSCEAKVVLICKQHGHFLQKPHEHLVGSGCPKCGYIKNSERSRSNTKEFLSKARLTHGDTYDYSKVDYKGSHRKVILICKNHGDFLQGPASHLAGHGCPKCALIKSMNILQSKPETEFLDYLNVPKDNRQYPIGKYYVDGIVNNTIYEFLGDYWHGHNRMEKGLTHLDIQMKRLLTQYRLTDIQKLTGFNIKYVWESDWNEYRKLGGQLKLRTFKDRLTID